MSSALIKIIIGVFGAFTGAFGKGLAENLFGRGKRKRERLALEAAKDAIERAKEALEPYVGTWHGWYRDPDRNDLLIKETWAVKPDGRVEVTRNDTMVFQGNIEVKNRRLYVTLDGVPQVSDERLFMTIKTNKAKTNSSDLVLHGIWLAEDGHDNVVGGHGVLTKAGSDDAGKHVGSGWLRLGLNADGYYELQLHKPNARVQAESSAAPPD